eukprot:ANDGO_00561.mRNA.1 hypothetical protein ABB37_09491
MSNHIYVLHTSSATRYKIVFKQDPSELRVDRIKRYIEKAAQISYEAQSIFNNGLPVTSETIPSLENGAVLELRLVSEAESDARTESAPIERAESSTPNTNPNPMPRPDADADADAQTEAKRTESSHDASSKERLAETEETTENGKISSGSDGYEKISKYPRDTFFNDSESSSSRGSSPSPSAVSSSYYSSSTLSPTGQSRLLPRNFSVLAYNQHRSSLSPVGAGGSSVSPRSQSLASVFPAAASPSGAGNYSSVRSSATTGSYRPPFDHAHDEVAISQEDHSAPLFSSAPPARQSSFTLNSNNSSMHGGGGAAAQGTPPLYRSPSGTTVRAVGSIPPSRIRPSISAASGESSLQSISSAPSHPQPQPQPHPQPQPQLHATLSPTSSSAPATFSAFGNGTRRNVSTSPLHSASNSMSKSPRAKDADREKEKVQKGAMEIAKANLAAFSKMYTEQTSDFDDNYTCVVNVHRDFNVLVTFDPFTERLHLYSTILTMLPKDPTVRLQLFERLLEGALLGREMSGGGVGISVRNELVLMHVSIDTTSASEDALSKMGPSFIKSLERWRRIAAEVVGSPSHYATASAVHPGNLSELASPTSSATSPASPAETSAAAPVASSKNADYSEASPRHRRSPSPSSHSQGAAGVPEDRMRESDRRSSFESIRSSSNPRSKQDEPADCAQQ